MCSSKDLVTDPFVRFGTTPKVFNDLWTGHSERNHTQSQERSVRGLPFFDYEVALLHKLLSDNKDNVPLCSLVVAIIYCVCEGEEKGLANESFVCFGLTSQVFSDLRVAHDVMNCSQPSTRSCNELPFFDWEATLLGKLLEDNRDNVSLCGLLAAMMYYVHESVQRKLAKNKPRRKDTLGMITVPKEEKASA